jgi:hypothetical protein
VNAVSKYVCLSRQERLLLLRSFMVVSIVRLGLWIFPFPTIMRTLKRLKSRRLRASCALHTIERLTWAVRVASRYVPQATCLTQGISGKLLIESCIDRDVGLQIGVRLNEQKRIEAHAWIECEGEVVLGGESASSFTPIFRM